MSEKDKLSFGARDVVPDAGVLPFTGTNTLGSFASMDLSITSIAAYGIKPLTKVLGRYTTQAQAVSAVHDLGKGAGSAFVEVPRDTAAEHEAFLSMAEQAASADADNAEAPGALAILGLESTAGEEDLVRAVKAGFSPSVVEALAAAGFDRSEIDRLVVPTRTLHRRRGNGRLSPQESDAALRLARVLAAAKEAFGDPKVALKWLRAPNSRFEGKKPIDFLKSEAGSRYIEDFLLRADLGMTA